MMDNQSYTTQPSEVDDEEAARTEPSIKGGDVYYPPTTNSPITDDGETSGTVYICNRTLHRTVSILAFVYMGMLVCVVVVPVLIMALTSPKENESSPDYDNFMMALTSIVYLYGMATIPALASFVITLRHYRSGISRADKWIGLLPFSFHLGVPAVSTFIYTAPYIFGVY